MYYISLYVIGVCDTKMVDPHIASSETYFCKLVLSVFSVLCNQQLKAVQLWEDSEECTQFLGQLIDLQAEVVRKEDRLTTGQATIQGK